MRALAVIATLALAGCAGARVAVTAEKAFYPISLSPVIADADGKLWNRSVLVKVGTFSAHRTSFGFFYSTLTPRSTTDVSEEVNRQVAAVGGEAVVGLTITVADDCRALNAFPVLPVLPFWPGCVPIVISGDIVKRPAAALAHGAQPGLRPLAAAPTTLTANTRPLK